MNSIYNFFSQGVFEYTIYYPSSEKVREQGKCDHLNRRHDIIKGYYSNGKLEYVNVYSHGTLIMNNSFNEQGELKRLRIYCKESPQWIKYEYTL